MNKLLNGETTLSKGIKTLLWVVVTNVVVAVLTTLVNKPDLYNPTVVSLANVLLVLVKNYTDPQVKNY